MAQGYDDGRFETPVDENLHCVICTDVLKDSVQCRSNEHHFCRTCITIHLQHSQTCPTCKDPLTVETLGRPQRFLADTLAKLKISCDNSDRGCREVIELGSLDRHVANCGFTPVPCSNDQCDEIINRRDKEIHENRICGFRRVKCDYCGQEVQYINYMEHTCPARKEIRRIKADIADSKADIADTKAKLNKVSSTQDEILKVIQNVMSSLMRIEKNMTQRSEARSAQDLEAEIVIAGGSRCKFVESFNMATKTWQPLSEMNECRYGASSVLFRGNMIVTGGWDGCQRLDSVEELNIVQQDGRWVKSQFKLSRVSSGHVCVVYENRLFVIGGGTLSQVYDSIYEINLTPPYASRLITKMPQSVYYHGAELINDKIYIVGGRMAGIDRTDIVLAFDPTTNTFTELKPLPYPVSYMATVTWKDNVVVLGGQDKNGNILNTVTLYNTTTGSHRMLPEMRKKRRGCTAVTIGHNIIVMGGDDETNTDLNSVECYNFDKNTWTEFPAMNEARWSPTAVVKYC